MKKLLQHLEELGIVLRRNLSNVVSSVRFRLTLGFMLLLASTIFIVDLTITYVRKFVIFMNVEDSNLFIEHGAAITEAFTQTLDAARSIDYALYVILILILTVISYRVAGIMLQPVTQALEAHQRFIRNANHELRTPITIATTALELALRKNTHTPVESPLVSASHTALAEIRHIEEILKNLNLISYIYAGHAPVKTHLDLVTHVTNATLRLQEVAAQKNITLDIITHNEPLTILAHEAALVQIVTNIVSNAIKYTPEGGSVQVTMFPDGAYASFVVHDSGIGISKDELDKLFEPFFRSSRVQHIEGTGLGLAVVHELVKLNNGILTVLTPPEDTGHLLGTAFKVRFRRAAS